MGMMQGFYLFTCGTT